MQTHATSRVRPKMLCNHCFTIWNLLDWYSWEKYDHTHTYLVLSSKSQEITWSKNNTSTLIKIETALTQSCKKSWQKGCFCWKLSLLDRKQFWKWKKILRKYQDFRICIKCILCHYICPVSTHQIFHKVNTSWLKPK